MSGILTAINERLLGENTWPPKPLVARWEDVAFLAALRRGDETALRQRAGVAWKYPYLVTPLPRMISRTSANMLFGEPAEITPTAEADVPRLDFLVTENALDAEAHRGAMISSSEGDVWGRIVVQPAVLDAPIIEFVSGARVIPHFSGRFLLGATFVTEFPINRTEVVRLFETYEAGAVTSNLYRGTRTRIGAAIGLDTFAPTEGVQEVVLTGIDRPLVAFIPNSVDEDPTRGFSDYRGLEERFLAVNESVTTGQRNMRLTGRKRALIDASYLDEEGVLSRDDDLLVKRGVLVDGDGNAKPLEVLEYGFAADQVVAWIDSLIDSTLIFAGIAPQMVGRSVDGGAISGTALKLKAMHSLIEASGKGRHFDRGLRTLLRYAAVIDSRPTTQGGFGRKWSKPDDLPSIERAPAMPRDDHEAAQELVWLTQAEAISVEERVRYLHPDWTDEQVQDEVDRLGQPAPGSVPALPLAPRTPLAVQPAQAPAASSPAPPPAT